MILSHIVAASQNRVIGVKGDLPWHIPEDLKYFKEKTSNRVIIMGRKTFESIGSKPLPKRYNIVITSSPIKVSNVVCVKTIEEAIQEAGKQEFFPKEEVFIVGGGYIYKDTIHLVNRIYYTHIEQTIDDGEVFYPEIPSYYRLISQDQRQGFSFQIYENSKKLKT